MGRIAMERKYFREYGPDYDAPARFGPAFKKLKVQDEHAPDMFGSVFRRLKFLVRRGSRCGCLYHGYDPRYDILGTRKSKC